MRQHQELSIWLFDSQCVLCEGGVQYTLRHEKAASIRFVSIQSPGGRELALAHGVNPDNPLTFLFIENGIALKSSDAVIALARHLNGPARIVPLLKVIPKPVRDYVYRVVAKHRYRIFGQKAQCILPKTEHKHRFSV